MQHETTGPGSAPPNMSDVPPSGWPLVWAVSLAMLGGAITWRLADPGNDLTAPFLGAAIATTALGGLAWLHEAIGVARAGRAREAGARTVVTTFEYDQANETTVLEEVVPALEGLRAGFGRMAGFRDLRISVSDTEPFRGIVETTWARESDATARGAAARDVRTLLGDAPVTSVEGTELSLMRDTKSVAVRLGPGTALAVVGAFVLGAFAFGSATALIDSDDDGAPVAPNGNGDNGGPPTFEGVIVARNIRFVQTEFTVGASTEQTVTMSNEDDGIPHNITFFRSDEAGEGGILDGCIEGCEEPRALRTSIENGPIDQTFTFTAPATPGRYAYWCDVHPDTMQGVMIVE